MFATFKVLAVYLTFGPVAGLLGIPYTLLVGDVSRLYRAAMWIVRTGLRFGGIAVEVTGREHLPAGQSCIFMCNHVSNLDPPVVIPILPGRCAVLLKKELMSIPILGTAMRLAGFIPVERGARRDAAKASVVAAAKAIEGRLHILVFPEGTRSADGRLQSFKKGPFFLAEQTGAPIIPLAISGTEQMMGKGSIWIKPGVARAQMLRPIWPREFESREELMAAVHTALAKALPDSMKPVAAQPR